MTIAELEQRLDVLRFRDLHLSWHEWAIPSSWTATVHEGALVERSGTERDTRLTAIGKTLDDTIQNLLKMCEAVRGVEKARV